MPSDENQQCVVHDDEADAAGQLETVRARVATLCQRIKASRDPDAIREVQNELNRVGTLLVRKHAQARTGRARQRSAGDGSEDAMMAPWPEAPREDDRG